ncbi:hypothetical protein KR054_003849, partial [Drosophila jambulina]
SPANPASPAEECGCVRLGKCKWFNVAKGWGFLTPNDGGQEVFVHQSVIQMAGFRSLGEQEEVEFECQRTARGLEATRVSGKQGESCHGSTYRPRINRRTRRMRCYNCGEFANHIASECALGPQPKRCHRCRGEDHLHADCPHRNVVSSQRSLIRMPGYYSTPLQAATPSNSENTSSTGSQGKSEATA